MLDYVSRETVDKLYQYKDLLLKWNKTINLISKNSVVDLFQRHIVDSLQLMKFIDTKFKTIVDLGSGGGLPGIVLSIAGIKKMVLIESDSRKCAFLNMASKISSNKIVVLNKRAQDIKSIECDILTSRAFGKLDSIFQYNNILVKEKYLIHKGKSYKEEMKYSSKSMLFDVTIHDSITSSDGKILEIKL